jgi:DNA-binding transcriptional LysR family regulator
MEKPFRQWDSRIGRRLTLRDLHILSSVVQWGSMAKAASHLAMSQPAVSESIATLETALCVPLLNRSTRGVEPTLYAQALLGRSHVVFDELRQAIRDIEFLANPTTGEVRVAAGDTLCAGLLPVLIAQVSRDYPEIVIRVIQANGDSLDFRELRERRVDLALARVAAAQVDDDLNVDILFDDPHRVVVGAKSPWARRRRIMLSELVNEPWIFASNQVIRKLIEEAFNAQGLKMPQERVSANSILLRNHLLATGRFVTVLPESVLRSNGKQWSLLALPVDLKVKPRSVAIVTLKSRDISPVVKLFIDQMRKILATTPLAVEISANGKNRLDIT